MEAEDSPATSLLYVTASSRDEALAIGRAAVEEQLAACANVLEGMTSIYRWQGQLEQSTECVLLLKTRSELVPRLIDRVRGLHSYECPCIVELPVTGGYPAYLQWIADSTGDRSTG